VLSREEIKEEHPRKKEYAAHNVALVGQKNMQTSDDNPHLVFFLVRDFPRRNQKVTPKKERSGQ